jgi:hypothetical protein
MKSDFDVNDVKRVSEFLQNYMKKNNIDAMVPDKCADLLAKNKILPNNVGPKPGFNFRQMLRDGYKGLIPLVEGARQKAPHYRWYIDRINE